MSNEPAIQFFVDRCVGRYVYRAMRNDGLDVVYLDDLFPDDTPDDVWIAHTGQNGMVVITKDLQMSRKQVEKKAIIQGNCRVFSFNNAELPGLTMAQIILTIKESILLSCQTYPAPFWFKIDRFGNLSEVAL